MKMKYHIWKSEEKNILLIKEYAVLTAESRKQEISGLQQEDFSLLCEQTYQADEVRDASSQGKDELILLLRNQHFFPIGLYIGLIADTVISMFASKGEQHEDLIFDDRKIILGDLPAAGKSTATGEEISDKPDSDIDELLEDDSQIKKDNSTEDADLAQLNEEDNY